MVGDFNEHLGELPERRAAHGRRSSAARSATSTPTNAPTSSPGWPRPSAPGDSLLLGTDLVKDRDRLVAAYDDGAGVTAAFNKNLLDVLNRELGADFDPEQFDHVARFDEARLVHRDAPAFARRRSG